VSRAERQPGPRKAMIRRFGSLLSLKRAAQGSQIVEFAVALPLLVVFVVGIFDFGNAFNLKHKIANAALMGARFASTQPSSDLTDPLAGNGSVQSVARVVAFNLSSAKVSDCGLAISNALDVSYSPPRTWTYTKNTNPCAGTLTLTIERGYAFQLPASPSYPGGMTVEATRVTLSYPYKWQFNRVIQFLVPGATFQSSSQITAVAVMQNLN
jgi:Flp pilus assembly protein TadG